MKNTNTEVVKHSICRMNGTVLNVKTCSFLGLLYNFKKNRDHDLKADVQECWYFNTAWAWHNISRSVERVRWCEESVFTLCFRSLSLEKTQSRLLDWMHIGIWNNFSVFLEVIFWVSLFWKEHILSVTLMHCEKLILGSKAKCKIRFRIMLLTFRTEMVIRTQHSLLFA